MREQIKMKKDSIYLNDTLKKLPKNCILDKGKVGCGGTTLALESIESYIICVPFVSMIENKVTQYPNERYDGEIFGFYGGVLKRDLVSYLERTDIKKIIVTYDSLEKLIKWINPDEYSILIDELHLLFTEYSYRSEASQSVLRNYSKFKEFCFMTATPLEEEFILEELRNLPVVEVVWDDVLTVEVQSIKCGKVIDSVALLVNDFINRKYEENAYFFVNSVKYIKDIITSCGLNNNNCRVIYSKNNKTNVGIERGSTLDVPKKINFITSTAFEGSDIYDEQGVVFIVSDGSEINTLIDISTKFQQIAGRIRNSKFNDKIYHLFKETRYSSLSYDEFRNLSDKLVRETKEFVADVNGKSYANKLQVNDLYIRKEGSEFIFDPNKVKIDLYNFKICRSIYSLRVNLNEEYAKYKYEIKAYDHIAESLVTRETEDMKFEDVVLMVKNESEELRLNYPIRDAAFKRYDFLEEAIEKVGYDFIIEKGITATKRKLIMLSDKGLEVKIFKLLKSKLNITNGDFIKGSDIKVKFNEIYTELNIKKTAKSTDITAYYMVQDKVIKVNGVNIRGYVIVRPLIIFG